MIIKTSLNISAILKNGGFFKKQQMLYKQPFASRYHRTPLMRIMGAREQEGCSAGVNYLVVGWSRARSELVGEGGEVQQGD